MRAGTLLIVMLVVAAPVARAQEKAASAWSGSATLFSYLIPGAGDYAQPTVALDRKALHVEGRFNYEALRTGSLWAGYNFEGGSTVTWTFTPMGGGAFGDVGGLAPGYTGSLAWRKLDFYSEGEYLFDLGTPADSFLYNWSELAVAPVPWLRAGVVTQRTRVRATDREIQRGPFVGLTHGRFEVGAYMLDAADHSPSVVLSFAWTFGPD
jgi:hypothetical protein